MQFFGIEEIKPITKTSQTTLEWEQGSNLRIGGKAYKISSDLILNLATDIDTGTVDNNKIYYVYAVAVSGVVSLKYSLSSEAPTGFAAFRKIGALTTDGSAEILDAKKGTLFKKWQRKINSSAVSAAGVIPGLTFNNLNTEKTYSIKSLISVQRQNLTVNDKTFKVTFNNVIYPGLTNIEGRAGNVATYSISLTPSFDYAKISSNTVSVEALVVANTEMLINTSWVELSELSDNTMYYDAIIETNEW
jgi:hypothetical protein